MGEAAIEHSEIIHRRAGNLLIIDSGLNEGWSTPIIPKFEQDDPLKVSSDEVACVVNLMYVGVGLGSIVPFLLMDRIGRKGTLLFATIPKIASWILIGLAATITQLYVGRILAGIGCGITYAVMPMYLGEVSSKRTRGPLGSIHFHFLLCLFYLIPGSFIIILALYTFRRALPFSFVFQSLAFPI